MTNALSKILMLTCFVICSQGTSSFAGLLTPPIIDPKTHASPSGRFTLRVVPSSVHGVGPASYVFSDSKVESWAGQRPFTIWDAHVLDSGLVIAYAYSQGLGSVRDSGDMMLLVLKPNGELQFREDFTRRNGFPDQPANPYAKGILVFPESDRFVIRLADADVNRSAETWREYSISTCKKVDEFRPADRLAESKAQKASRCVITEAVSIPGTSAAILHWIVISNQIDAELVQSFTLTTLDGDTVWTCEDQTDARLSVANCADRFFRIVDTTRRLEHDFSVSYDAVGAVTVNRHDAVTAPVLEPRASVQSRSLRPAGDLHLRFPDDEDHDPPPVTATRAKICQRRMIVHINFADQVYALDKVLSVLYVFDLTGRLLRTYPPAPNNEDVQHPFSRIAVREDGVVCLFNDDVGRGHASQCFYYSSWTQPPHLEALPFVNSSGYYFQPRSDRRWVRMIDGFLLADRADRVLNTLLLCPDDRWIMRPYAAAVAPNGSLAFIARSGVHLFSAKGEPVRTVMLPSALNQVDAQIAFDGERVVVAQGSNLFLLDRVPLSLKLDPPPEASPLKSWTPHFASGTGELLLFDGSTRFVRYQLPRVGRAPTANGEKIRVPEKD
jgi:hypothetical protein